MFRGFVAGTLALVVLYVAVQPGPSQRLGIASSTAVAGLRRLFSPEIAGLRDYSTPATGGKSGTSVPPATGAAGAAGSGGGAPKFTNLLPNTGGQYFTTNV